MAMSPVSCKARVLICSSCVGSRSRQAEEAALRTALQQAGLTDLVRLEFGGCFNACSEPVAIGLQGEGRASYVFSGIDLERDADALAATCRAFLDARKGWIIDGHACGRLRNFLRARVPALP